VRLRTDEANCAQDFLISKNLRSFKAS